MTTAIAILALILNRQAAGAASGQGQDPRAFNFDGEPVTLSLPAPSQDAVPSADVAGWSGWASLAGTAATFDAPFMGTGNWSDVEQTYVGVNANGAIPWRIKIVLLARTDTLLTRQDGTLEDRRKTITGERFIETLNAIPEFIALVSSMTDGKVRIVPDVRIDPEPSRDVAAAGKPSFDSSYLIHYLAGRINGGSYESDDKLYRGPYNSVLFIDPCERSSPLLENPSARISADTFHVDGTPAGRVSFDSAGGGSASGALAVALFDAWTATVSDRAVSQGLPAVSGALKTLDWTALSGLAETPTNLLLSRLAARPKGDFELVPLPAGLELPTFKTANVKLSIAQDSSKGKVLAYVETPVTRFGGFVLPHGPAPIDVAKSPTLTIEYKTSSDQPICLAIRNVKGQTHWISLGRDPQPIDGRIPRAASLPIENDGTWHAVSVGLQALGSEPVDQIRLGASPSAAVQSAELAVPVSYEFAEFRLGSEIPTPALTDPKPDFASPDPAGRSLAALEAGKAGKPSPELAALLKDPTENVVLNALEAYSLVADPYAEPKLIELAGSPVPRISEMALRALDHQNTPAAAAEIEKAMKSGFEYTEEVAAMLIAGKHDPKSATDLVVLSAGTLWHTRLAAVDALAEVPGIPSQIMRLALLPQDDPMIKLAIIEHTDPQNQNDMTKLLWTAVNEPSDLVRAESDEQLIQSQLPNMREEGLKGVRDDSWWTRVLVLRFLKDHPIEAARGAIKLGLSDPSGSVRSAAIEALGGFPSVTLDDVKPCLDDPNPAVDLALSALAKAHKLQLPEATIEMIKRSPDPSVAQALGS
jgi:HEAT repeat protein